jgi:hypothetical protein
MTLWPDYARVCAGISLIAALLIGAGCETTKDPLDPLLGWKSVGEIGFKVDEMHGYIETFPGDQAIADDIRTYINNLPISRGQWEDRRYCYWITHMTLFQDGAGQHAVRIQIPVNGKHQNHVLLYNPANKRTKVIRYSSGSYRC